MSSSPTSTRQRLIHTALDLFAQQGITITTTRQIAETAGVNEVTLFRQFGSKYGLLLAVMEEAAVFTDLGQSLVSQLSPSASLAQALRDYAIACLETLDQVPEVVRSVMGEAGSFPPENRDALKRGIVQINREVATYFERLIQQEPEQLQLSAPEFTSLLHSLLLGYALFDLTSGSQTLWPHREAFVANLVTLFLQGAGTSQSALSEPETVASDSSAIVLPQSSPVRDLPAPLVHTLLQRAKKQGSQDYALAYVLFGGGLSASEVVQLERSHYYRDTPQHLLRLGAGGDRQRPLNQWILGKRYGTPGRNPLTQWLKSRKDSHPALFINDQGTALTLPELAQRWQRWGEGLTAPDGRSLQLDQAQHTWCVEMLMRGMSLENLAILTHWSLTELQPYAIRAREKAALEEALRLDQKEP